MLSTRLPIGLSAWNIACNTPAVVAARALVARGEAVGVLAMLSTGLSVGVSAWDVAGHTTTSVAAARPVGIGVLAMLSTRHPVSLSAWDVAGHTSTCVGARVGAIALVAGPKDVGVLGCSLLHHHLCL